METLNGTEWDVLIVGTSIPQSLLALALSRSGKRVLHIDPNDFYGGSEAAFSLQEAEAWARSLGADAKSAKFKDVSIEQSSPAESGDSQQFKLSFSRAYSLALAPQLIYADSRLLSSLVSSKSYKHLEFLPMGCLWVYEATNADTGGSNDITLADLFDDTGNFVRVPTTREDVVFSDSSIDIRARRALMRVIRFIMDYQNQQEVWQIFAERPFSTMLRDHFKLPDRLHALLLATTMTPDGPQKTTTAYALPRLARHLMSTGRLGPGFSSIIPRWGGVSEICQVACRAAAVGGAVYVLNKALKTFDQGDTTEPLAISDGPLHSIVLGENEKIRVATVVAGSAETIGSTTSAAQQTFELSRSISIVTSPLATLIPASTSGGPSPAGAVVAFPSGSLPLPADTDLEDVEVPPVYFIIHNHDTGECPANQCILYGSVALPGSAGHALIDAALKHLFRVVSRDGTTPELLWTLRYVQSSALSSPATASQGVSSDNTPSTSRLKHLNDLSLDLVFDDSVLDDVEATWRGIVGDTVDGDEFLVFGNRQGEGENDTE